MSSIDQQFIEYIVKSLVGNPDDVKIERRIDEKGVLLELTVNPDDLGRVIGKRGSTAQSIRTLLRALGTKNDARYNLKIVDTGPPRPRDVSSAKDDSSSDSAKQDDTDGADAQDANAQVPVSTSSGTRALDDDDLELDDEPEVEKVSREDHSDVISRTRKELADLDDLDL